jgi:hypothetical protein
LRPAEDLGRAAETLQPFLNEGVSDAATLAVVGACIGALRGSTSPQAWAKNVADGLPESLDETRELGTLAAIPEVIETMMHAAFRFRRAQEIAARQPGPKQPPPNAAVLERLTSNV